MGIWVCVICRMPYAVCHMPYAISAPFVLLLYRAKKQYHLIYVLCSATFRPLDGNFFFDFYVTAVLFYGCSF
jgi:hypothetical protein